ncbi:MAG: prepilin peptidase [Spirochaetia bacterium]
MSVPGAVIFFLAAVPIAIQDFRSYTIPDIPVYAGIVLSSIFRVSEGELWWGIAIEIAAGFALFYLFWFFMQKRLGFGDVKLAAFIAAAVGFPAWFFAVLSGCILALVWAGVVTLSFDRDWKIPFAPFLCAGTLIAFFTFPYIEPILFGGSL